ncbi:HepT-like ribonuclease domain-containing protein [Aquabacterium sp.]|uniref:HepT-like ribonuclease domain-containing protein n=1 Tax=Aquabacterium sp. TaxID=1872578 RepID=UPI0025C3986D|nr:HepT-like ribonuclease domain-containing protein [Aquabacterium sp.]
MSKDWPPYALHVLDAIDKIDRIQQRGDLTQDEVLYDATLRNLQTLSEATQRLPDALKAQHPGIPWAQISGFRNILVHNYLGRIDALTVLSVVQQHLPPLAQAMRALLAEHGQDGRGAGG